MLILNLHICRVKMSPREFLSTRAEYSSNSPSFVGLFAAEEALVGWMLDARSLTAVPE